MRLMQPKTFFSSLYLLHPRLSAVSVSAFQTPHTFTHNPISSSPRTTPISNPNSSKRTVLNFAPNSNFIPSSQRIFNLNTMDDTLSKATTKRISALFSREKKSAQDGSTMVRDYSTKNRSKELKRLASNLEIDVPKLKDMLRNSRKKMKAGNEKAAYIDWILDSNTNSKKRQRKPSDATVSEEKKEDSDDNVARSGKPASKKLNRVRVKKPVKIFSDADATIDGNNGKTNTGKTNESAVQDPTLLSSLKFKDIEEIHPNSKRAITNVLKLESMTEIQSKTFKTAVQGTDVLGRARTGTGKTLAFLVPALERLLTSPDYKPNLNIGIIVISPTRELASQIGDQAQKLITYHKDLTCQVMYGGTKMNRDMNALNKRLPSILVATPGRLLDHMENTKLANGKKFGYDIMRETQILVLDETDRLLDMGFRNEIKKILNFLPKREKRQTLLFSATVPQELKQIMAENMKKDFVEVDCIHDGGNNPDGGTHTNSLVEQTYTVLPNLKRQVTAVVQLVKEQMESDRNHKIVVFFPTARMVGYFAEFFNLGLGIEVIELHSKKSQGYRNKASDKFRKATRGVLFTSDVSARGVDYPDVTGVIQVGLPESREQYIHRLGRTGRAGKKGQGILVLAPFEKKFINELKNIEIAENADATKLISGPIDPQITKSVDAAMNRIRSGDAKLTTSAEQCYQAFIGYYRGHMKRTTIKSKDGLVDTANALAKIMGLKEQPGLTKKAIGKMGLKGVKNLRIISEGELRAKKGGR